MKKYILFTASVFCLSYTNAQLLVNDGSTIFVTSGTTIAIQGGVQNKNSATITNNGIIKVTGDFTNQATVDGSGKMEFNGGSNQTVDMGGSGLYDLDVNKGSSLLILSNSVVVSHNIDLTGTGNFIQLGPYDLTLSNGTTITGSSSSSYIISNDTGMMIYQSLGGSAIIFPLGSNATHYTPVSLTNNGTADDIGVRVADSVYNTYDNHGTGSGSALSPAQEVHKTWVLNEATQGGSSLDMTLQWDAANEGSLFNRLNSAIAFYNSGWQHVVAGSAASGSGPYTLGRNGITQNLMNMPFGIGAGNSPLPVSFLSFDASLQGKDGLVHWTTVTEMNADYFQVLRSTDGVNYSAIGKRQAAGKSSQITNYNYIDLNVVEFSAQGIEKVYYKLLQYDRDGKTIDAGVRPLNLNGSQNHTINQVSLFPNPFNHEINLSYNLNIDQPVTYRITDMNGKTIWQNSQSIEKGPQVMKLSDLHMAAGIYMFHMSAGDENTVYKIVKCAD